MNKDGLSFMANFMHDHQQQAGMTAEKAKEIEQLWNEYKRAGIRTTDTSVSVLSADFGELGSIVVRDIKTIREDIEFKYDPGSYDYISVTTSKDKHILWTDFDNTEPYNRQGGLYADGMSWEALGAPVVMSDKYREFQRDSDRGCNMAFAVWGFRYNEYWKSVRFCMAIKTELVDEFITKLRLLINKPI